MAIDYEKKANITFSNLKGERMEFKGNGCQKTIPTIFAIQAFKMLRKGCQGYLCAIEVTEQKEPDFNEILVVREFSNVFQDVLGLPPDQEIEFTIHLALGTTPILRLLIA